MTKSDDHTGQDAADGNAPADGPRAGATPGRMGRDRVRDGSNYYEHDAGDEPGPAPAHDARGRGGSMGGGPAASDELLTTEKQTALGEPAGGTGGRIAGDSQGGSLADGSAADSEGRPAD